MPIEIPAEYRPFVDREMRTGLYQSEQDVINRALAELQRERNDAVEGIREGLKEAEDGKLKSLHDAFRDLFHELGLKDEE